MDGAARGCCMALARRLDTLNLVTVTALLKAYELAGFGLTYPIWRALSVLLVVPLAVVAAGETLSAYGLTGVALIAFALVCLGLGNAGDGRVPLRGLMWIALAAAALALNVLCDARGVRASGSPWAFGYAVSITNAAGMLVRQQLLGQQPLATMRGHADQSATDRDRLGRLLPADPARLQPGADRTECRAARHQRHIRGADCRVLAEGAVYTDPPRGNRLCRACRAVAALRLSGHPSGGMLTVASGPRDTIVRADFAPDGGPSPAGRTSGVLPCAGSGPTRRRDQ